jgi:hypothetical protein
VTEPGTWQSIVTRAPAAGISLSLNSFEQQDQRSLASIGNCSWGWRFTDDADVDGDGTEDGCGGSGSNGDAISIHSRTEYALVTDNLIWDSQQGIYGGGHFGNSSYIGNVIHGSGKANPGEQGAALGLHQGSGQEMYRNVIVDSEVWGGAISSDGDHMDIRCNVIIDSPGVVFGTGAPENTENIQADYNAYYGVGVQTLDLPGTNDVVMATAADAQHDELCFLTKMWTGPEVVCIPNARATVGSPHPAFCDGPIGYRPGVGINDELIP